MDDNDISKAIAKNLAFYRLKQNLTQKDIADRIGATRTTVSNWEQEVSKIDIISLAKVCTVLNVSLDDMYMAKNETEIEHNNQSSLTLSGIKSESVKNKIAKFLKEKRKQLNMSAELVTKELVSYGFSISPKTLYGYENGGNQPNGDMLIALCLVYGVENLMAELNLDIPLNNDSDAITTTDEPDKTIIKKFLQLKTERSKYKVEGLIEACLADEYIAEPQPESKEEYMPDTLAAHNDGEITEAHIRDIAFGLDKANKKNS